MTTPLAAKIAREYGTPCAVIDMDRVERNIARVQVACDTAGVANRPHIKTHKSPLLAQMQVAAGAKGITCQKIGEAEIMADAASCVLTNAEFDTGNFHVDDTVLAAHGVSDLGRYAVTPGNTRFLPDLSVDCSAGRRLYSVPKLRYRPSMSATSKPPWVRASRSW